MKDKFVITAISKLMRGRIDISGPMEKEQAEARLQREIENRRRQRYQVYSHLRVEKQQPVQLNIKFEDYE